MNKNCAACYFKINLSKNLQGIPWPLCPHQNQAEEPGKFCDPSHVSGCHALKHDWWAVREELRVPSYLSPGGFSSDSCRVLQTHGWLRASYRDQIVWGSTCHSLWMNGWEMLNGTPLASFAIEKTEGSEPLPFGTWRLMYWHAVYPKLNPPTQTWEPWNTAADPLVWQPPGCRVTATYRTLSAVYLKSFKSPQTHFPPGDKEQM